MVIVGLGGLFNYSVYSWGWASSGILVIWGIEILIKGFIDEANKKSSSELKAEIETLRNEIKSKEEDDFNEKHRKVFVGDANYTKEDGEDEMYEEARACVIEAGRASTSYLQRKLKLGYARAARLMDELERRGVIGQGDGAKPREVIINN